MSEAIENKVKRNGWAAGPWDGEADRIEWRSNGVPCLIVRNSIGALCGYAAVTPDHPWYGKDYSDCVKGCAEVPVKPLESIFDKPVPESIQKRHMDKKNFTCREDYKPDHTPESIVDVHGGLTYSNSCNGAICHVPKPGEPDPVWWFGFDCAHSGDIIPGMDALLNRVSPRLWDGAYKTVAYVKAEVERLASQLQMANGR